MSFTTTLIERIVPNGSVFFVTFSNIPQTYTDLCLRASLRSASGATEGVAFMRFNGDTATNYSTTRMYSYATASMVSDRFTNVDYPRLGNIEGNAATTNVYSTHEVYIANYRSSAFKSFTSISMVENNSAGIALIVHSANLWRGTSAIQSLVFGEASGNNLFTISSLSLYGISNTV